MRTGTYEVLIAQAREKAQDERELTLRVNMAIKHARARAAARTAGHEEQADAEEVGHFAFAKRAHTAGGDAVLASQEPATDRGWPQPSVLQAGIVLPEGEQPWANQSRNVVSS